MPDVVANADDAGAWQSGRDYQLVLREPVRVYWPDSPIRDALTRLSVDRRVAIFLDRRIDPGKKVDYRPKELAPLADLLKDFAAGENLGVASVGSVVYIGPQTTAAKIPTLLKLRLEELRKMPRAVAQQLATRRAAQWEMLATPQQLLASAEQDYGVQISGKELAPHDLWPAASLPELSFSERMTLLLAGFDLTYEFANGAFRLIPIPDRMTLVKSDGGRVVRRTVEAADTRYTLTVENQPVGAIMKALAARLSLELKIDPSAEKDLDKLVSLQVKEVTRDHLLRAALEPADLDFRIEETIIVLFAKEGSRE